MANAPKAVITETQPVFGYVKGITKWAKILEPDQYGKYSVNMYLDDDTLEEQVNTFNKVVTSAMDEVVEAGKKVAGKAEFLKEDDDGKKFLSFKLDETKYDGSPNKIEMYNAFGQKVDDWDKLVGNGSTVKIKYMAKPYYMASTKMVGVSLKFYAMQVIDLVEYSGGGDAGFGDETGDAPFDSDTSSDF
jgi:hypothetical protein